MGHFFKDKSTLLFALTSLVVLVSIECDPYTLFTCPKKGESLPSFPPAFSSDIRLNFATKMKTVELRHYKDEEGKRESLEIFAPDRHVKYIVHGDQHLLITFLDNDFDFCSVKSSSSIQLEDEDSGPNGVIQKMWDVLKKNKGFYLADAAVNNGIFVKKWEGCFKDPSVNVSFSFSEVDWNNPMKGSKNKKLPVNMEAQIGNDFVVGLVDNFQASMPEDIYFQPPENVFCSGFREDKKIPDIPENFSYDAEMILFDTRDGPPLIVSHRSVYFDYNARIARVDFHDPESEIQDVQSKLKAKGISVIHDYNSKIQYSFTLPAFKCEVQEFETTIEVVEEKDTQEGSMITAKEYFSLDGQKISYNGQFMTRGYLADVYTAAVKHIDNSIGTSIYTWYFSSVRTQIVEKDKLEKNVLLRMVVHPETGSQRNDRIEMNLYNFEKDEPSPQVFDISNCYNESLSKLFVLTFPANNALRGSQSFLKLAVHLALKKVTGLSKQRILVTEVAFNKEFMFAEFKILEAPSSLKKVKGTKSEDSLDAAAAKIKKSVSDGSLQLSVRTDDGLVTIIPLKNGFNEFNGDRKIQDPESFSQGSVIGLTIGMLLLGFVVGGIVLNLVVSRKFGVSLFQKKSGVDNFNNPLNESGL